MFTQPLSGGVIMKTNSLVAVFMIFFIFPPLYLLAEDQPAGFEHLTTFNIPNTLGEYFDKITIQFDTGISTVIDTTYYDVDIDGDVLEELGLNRRLIVTRIDRNDSALYTVDFSPGPSVDPNFRIYRNIGGELKRLTKPGIGGTHLIIPGDGFLYISGHTNNTFDHKRLFRVEGDEVIEVEQPFFYVGLQSVTNKEIVLTSLIGQVATLPKGTPVTVLLKQNENSQQYTYLVKTDFGLVGWVRFKPQELYIINKPNPIEGLFFKGD